MKLLFIMSFIILLAGFCWLLLLGGYKDYDNNNFLNWGDFDKPNKEDEPED